MNYVDIQQLVQGLICDIGFNSHFIWHYSETVCKDQLYNKTYYLWFIQ